LCGGGDDFLSRQTGSSAQSEFNAGLEFNDALGRDLVTSDEMVTKEASVIGWPFSQLFQVAKSSGGPDGRSALENVALLSWWLHASDWLTVGESL
jgi:hypothetical protein